MERWVEDWKGGGMDGELGEWLDGGISEEMCKEMGV